MSTNSSTNCIFCLKNDGGFSTLEHIVPVSLGGGDWSVLNKKVICDKCQNYFGAKIERAVLSTEPFNQIRTFAGLPTRKGKMPFFDNPLEGLFQAHPDGSVEWAVHPRFLETFSSGQKTLMILPVFTPNKDTHAKICQFLVKMGLELISDNDTTEIYEERYNPARDFCRYKGIKGEWFYSHCINFIDAPNNKLTGVSTDPESPISVSIIRDEPSVPPIVEFEFFRHKFHAPLTKDYVADIPEMRKHGSVIEIKNGKVDFHHQLEGLVKR